MSIVSVEELVSAGVHFGHPASSWNPKMKPYIFGKQNLIHIIDIKETVKGLLRACHFLHEMALLGEEILLIGTKRQARQIIEEVGTRLGIPYVSERWLGGMLTNYSTIRERLKRLEEIERMEETGLIKTFSKKMISSLLREKKKIKRNLDGVRHMTRLPGVMVIVDPKREYIAVKEAKKLNIPVVAVIDTDSDPDLIDIAIPGNDDAYRAISTIVHKLSLAIEEGKTKYEARMEILRKEQEEKEAAKVKTEALKKEKAAKDSIKKSPKSGETKKTRKKTIKKVTPVSKEVEKAPEKAETEGTVTPKKIVTKSKTGTRKRAPKVKSKTVEPKRPTKAQKESE